MKENCDRVIAVADRIRTLIPSIDLYVPAEHEDFVGIAYADKYLTRDQILEIDCKIIDKCDVVIIFCPVGDPIQGGRATEKEHAIATSKPVLEFDHAREAVGWLTHHITRS
jgi:nucleoside 2-deoxyribosyltransferase